MLQAVTVLDGLLLDATFGVKDVRGSLSFLHKFFDQMSLISRLGALDSSQVVAVVLHSELVLLALSRHVLDLRVLQLLSRLVYSVKFLLEGSNLFGHIVLDDGQSAFFLL